MNKNGKSHFQSRYNFAQPKGLKCETPSKAKQEFRKEADINTLLSKYERTGMALPRGDAQPMFGDFTAPELQDYRQALDTVRGAGKLMDSLPAKTRARFGNNVADLLLFVQDPLNRQEAIELGLINPPAEPAAAPPEEKKP